MSVKGSWIRPAEISRIEHELRQELCSPKTSPERKQELSEMFDFQSHLLKLKANIHATDKMKQNCQDVLDGKLPYLQLADGKEIYFPWSEKYAETKE